MKKLDFAILISIIKLIKLKFPTLNVLFLDEIFASLDSDSVSQVIQILSKTAKDIEMNIFVINHAQLDHTEFDYVINVQKTNGFSNIEVHKVT